MMSNFYNYPGMHLNACHCTLVKELHIAPQTGGIVKCHTSIVNYDMGETQELEEIFYDQRLCNRRAKSMGNKTEILIKS